MTAIELSALLDAMPFARHCGVDKDAAVAVGRPLHVGGRFIVVQTPITDSDERLVAQITQTQAVLRS